MANQFLFALACADLDKPGSIACSCFILIWKGSNIEGYEYILDRVKYLCVRRGTYRLFRRCGGTDKAAFSVAVPMRPSHPQRSFDAKRILEEIGGCAVTTRG